MRQVLLGLCLLPALVAPALAGAPMPRFESPQALLDTIYGSIEASNAPDYDYENGIEPFDAFSSGLRREIEAADAIVNPTGEYMGAMDFSPYISGQDAGGMSFDIEAPVLKKGKATAVVHVLMEGEPLHDIKLELVEERDGWKVDDFVLPGNEGPAWRLSDYLADPQNF